MNLSKREFLQVLGVGTMAGMALGQHAQADSATAANGLYDIPKFGNVSFFAHDGLPCAAQAGLFS